MDSRQPRLRRRFPIQNPFIQNPKWYDILPPLIASLRYAMKLSKSMVTPIQPATQTLYDQDYYLWLKTTINQLRTGQFSVVDLDNLIEELESMGRSEKRAVKSLLIRLLEHLLKLKYWDVERERNEGHWQGEIRTFRREIKDELKDSPSLKPYILEIFDECYKEARAEASDRSKLPIDTFPVAPIGSLEQILDEDWLPDYIYSSRQRCPSEIPHTPHPTPYTLPSQIRQVIY